MREANTVRRMATSPEAGTARCARLIASDDEASAAADEYAEAIAAGAAERDRAAKYYCTGAITSRAA